MKTQFKIGDCVKHANVTNEKLTISKLFGQIAVVKSDVYREVPLNKPTNTHIMRLENLTLA